MRKTVRKLTQVGILVAAVGVANQLHANQKSDLPIPVKKTFVARVTLYNGRGDGYGKKTAMVGRLSQHGKTAAGDFRIIPPGSTVQIKDLRGIVGDGKYEVIDTGSDVKSRKAARNMAKILHRKREISEEEYMVYKNAPVVDIYVDVSDKKLDELANRLPYFCLVEVRAGV